MSFEPNRLAQIEERLALLEESTRWTAERFRMTAIRAIGISILVGFAFVGFAHTMAMTFDPAYFHAVVTKCGEPL